MHVRNNNRCSSESSKYAQRLLCRAGIRIFGEVESSNCLKLQDVVVRALSRIVTAVWDCKRRGRCHGFYYLRDSVVFEVGFT